MITIQVTNKEEKLDVFTLLCGNYIQVFGRKVFSVEKEFDVIKDDIVQLYITENLSQEELIKQAKRHNPDILIVEI